MGLTASALLAAGPARAVDPIDVLARLGDLGPPSEIRAHSPALAAGALALDRVLLTGVRSGMLAAEALHVAAGDPRRILATLRGAPVALEYPLVEGEIMRRRRAQVVSAADPGAGGQHAFMGLLGWTVYAVAPILVEGRVVGFFHGDREPGGHAVGPSDAEGLAAFAACFAVVYERAVLRQRLRIQRQELRQVASWADGRAGELGDRSIGLDEGGVAGHDGQAEPAPSGEHALRDLLTRRELEVLELMVRGETNVEIARDLVLSGGTVKFHVKNILRKLHVSNRAQATSRYLRLTLGQGPGAGDPSRV